MNSGPHTLLRRFVPTRTLSIAGLLVAVALVAATPLEALAATPYNTNLVKNPGAQSGVSHWDTFPSGDFQVHKYGKPGFGFPSKATASAMGGGTYFFYAGPYDNTYGTCGDANQQWTLTGLNTAIDTGHVKVFLRGYAGTNGSPLIKAHIDLYFRDASNHPVASNGITKAASGTNEKYKLISASKVLSKNTRILRLHLWADGDATISSGDCQAFWDKLSVVLKPV